MVTLSTAAGSAWKAADASHSHPSVNSPRPSSSIAVTYSYGIHIPVPEEADPVCKSNAEVSISFRCLIESDAAMVIDGHRLGLGSPD